MRTYKSILLAGAGLAVQVPGASAQDEPPTSGAVANVGEIIVTARRRDETAQDVPLTVNAISATTLQQLNIRDLKDISSIVPGLTLNPGVRVTGPIASLRGVSIDVNSSGNNGTVEFYLNDAPISAGVVLQSVYDIGQIEVLRGPQGTLRGRASPSGSITITTRRPDLYEFGGYAEGTATTRSALNLQGAINVPVIEGVLGLRVAGLIENNEANQIESINNRDINPRARTRAFRASLQLTPIDNVEINASYSRLTKRAKIYEQVESANLALGTPAIGRLVNARDRAAIQDLPRENRQSFKIFNWQAKWSFAGQRLDYLGNFAKQELSTLERLDRGDFFDVRYPGDRSASTQNLQNLATAQSTDGKQETHELRLSSEDRLFGLFDYIIGAIINRVENPSVILTRTPVFAGSITPANFRTIVESTSLRAGRTIEKAVFGNVTAHFGERTEVSGGLRYIHYSDSTNTAGNATDDVHRATIWNASVKHRINDGLMIYANAGSSWRLSTGTNPLILSRSGINPATLTDPVLSGLFNLAPERSNAYEIGFKSSWLDKKLNLNVAAFHQKFDGYIFSTIPVYITNYSGSVYQNPVRTVAGLGVGVPVTVNGIEAEIAMRPSSQLDFGVSTAYAKSRIKDGVIPCTPASPPASNPPTIVDIQAGVSGRQVGACVVNQTATTLSPFSASLRSEYRYPIANGIGGFVRGLVDFKANSVNEPQNPYDDIKAYALANVYLGVRSEEKNWEVTAYAKNLFNTFRVFSRDSSPATLRTSAGTTLSNYRLLSVSDPREFGLTARFMLGSR